MATNLGAKALHLSHLTGSLEPGKRADLIVIDVSALHNSPRFRRDPAGVYAQIVYAAKASDVKDVMVNGKWLMRAQQIDCIDENELKRHAESYAGRIDTFLIQREKSVLSKLVALSNATEEESFEVQTKVRIDDAAPVLEAIQKPEIEILRARHYHEFDTYFLFDDPEQGTLRYREDEMEDPSGKTGPVRYRLTLIGPVREHQFPSDVLLSRSRFLAPATHSLRFYREYFKPNAEVPIEKDRLRWRVLFRGTEFFINLDRVDQPSLGYFLEIKSRTWSQRDAEHKAHMTAQLVEYLGVSSNERITQDYLKLAQMTV
jgi:5-methylthioadenosine/S-adenosylhomocysteine deaminase